MANWRRGFFRLWMLLSLIWIVFMGIVFSGSILNPYASPVSFTYDANDQLESLRYGTERYTEVTTAYVEGRYEMVAFTGLGPEVTYYAPNFLRFEVRGQPYTMRPTTAVWEKRDRAEIVDALTKHISEKAGYTDLDALRIDIEQAVPTDLKLMYDTPEHEAETKVFAYNLAERAKADARLSVIGWSIGVALIPPLVVLLLGAGVGWALTGFRRERAPS